VYYLNRIIFAAPNNKVQLKLVLKTTMTTCRAQTKISAQKWHWSTDAIGVESKADLTQLKKLDCDFAQGYYFSKPLTVKDATAYIAKQLKPVRKKNKNSKKKNKKK
ncbi:MAG: hypothetical protein QF503_11085, partial [Rhodospirillales bacterium]|nr:hypothetical protein [Rhodospirillales bacterium]